MADVPQYTTVARPKDYWMSPRALSITRNALGEANRIAASVTGGSQFFCHFENIGDVQAETLFGYDVAHNFRSWPLSISQTYFNTDETILPHIAIPRRDKSDAKAMVVFPTERLDLWGYATDAVPMQDDEGNYIDDKGDIVDRPEDAATAYVRKKKTGTDIDADPIGSEDYYYIYLHGKLMMGIVGYGYQRYWDPEIDWGRLNTDETWGEVITLEQLAKEMKKKVDVEWFQRVFTIHGTGRKRKILDYDEDGEPIYDYDEDGNIIYEGEDDERRDIRPNDMDHEITDTESMFGTWARQWVSALGMGSGGGGGEGGDALEWPLLDINTQGMPTPGTLGGPQTGDAIVYDSTLNGGTGGFKWGKTGGGLSGLHLYDGTEEILPTVSGDSYTYRLSENFLSLKNGGIVTGQVTVSGANLIVAGGTLTVGGDILLNHAQGFDPETAADNAVLTKKETETLFNGKYVTIDFFESLFELHSGASGNPKIDTNADLSEYTAQQKALFNIKSLFGTWTEQYLSALGIGSDGSSGGVAYLSLLEDVNVGTLSPTDNGKALIYDSTLDKWVKGTAGIDTTELNTLLYAKKLRIKDGNTLLGNEWNARDGGEIDISALLTSKTWWGRTLNNDGKVRGDIEDADNIYVNKGKGIYMHDSDGNKYNVFNISQTDSAYAGNELFVGYGLIKNSYAKYYNLNLYGSNIKHQHGVSAGNPNGYWTIFRDSGHVTINANDNTVSGRDIFLNVGGNTKTNRLYLYIDPSGNTANDVYLEYVSGQSGVHLYGAGFYADTYVSALGVGSQGGAVTGIDWDALIRYDNDNTHRIAKEYLSQVTCNLTGTVNGTPFTYNGTSAVNLGEIGSVASLTSLTIKSGNTNAVVYNPTDIAKTLTVGGETNVLNVTAATGSLDFALATAYGDTKNPYAAKPAKWVLAGPVSGNDASPAFRALEATDIPTLTASKISDLSLTNGIITIGSNTITPLTDAKIKSDYTWWGQKIGTEGKVDGNMVVNSTSGESITLKGSYANANNAKWNCINFQHTDTSQDAWSIGMQNNTSQDAGSEYDFYLWSKAMSTSVVWVHGGGRSADNSGGCVSIGTRSFPVDTRLYVNGNIRAGGSNGNWIQIGQLRIVYEDSTRSLKVVDASNYSAAANFYATGAVSALGQGSTGGASTFDEEQMWEALGTSTGTYANSKIHANHLNLTGYALTADVTKNLTIKQEGKSDIVYNGTEAKEITIGSGVGDRLQQYTLNDGASLASFTHATDLIYTAKGGNNGCIDKPDNVDAFGLISFKTAVGYYGQMLMPAGVGRLYLRSSNSLNGGWSEVALTSDLTSYAKKADIRKLTVNGGTTKAVEYNPAGDANATLTFNAASNSGISVSGANNTITIGLDASSITAGKATQLASNVTLWGNAFNGMQSIGYKDTSEHTASLSYVQDITMSGSLNMARNKYINFYLEDGYVPALGVFGSYNVLELGYETAKQKSYQTSIYGNKVCLYGSYNTLGLTVGTDGSVSIGTSTIPTYTNGSSTVTPKLYVDGNIGASSNLFAHAVDLYATTPYIDFHSDRSTDDYTIRIISQETKSNDAHDHYYLTVRSSGSEKTGLVVSNSSSGRTGDYIRIGGATLKWTGTALECNKDFYSTGAVSALGTGSDGTPVSGVDWESLINWDGDTSHVINQKYLPTLQSLSWSYGSVTSASVDSYNGSRQKSLVIPSKTSHLTNDSNFITSSSLDDYLPLKMPSGGKAVTFTHLNNTVTFHNTASKWVAIGFKGQTEYLGFLSVSKPNEGTVTPYFVTAGSDTPYQDGSSVWYKILHAGNWSSTITLSSLGAASATTLDNFINNSSVSKSGETLTVKINGVSQSLTNTWRGIQDSLNSDSTTDSLSAKKGKELYGYITTLQGYFDNGVAKSAAKLTTTSKKLWGNTYWTSGGVPTDIGTSSSNASLNYVQDITMSGSLNMARNKYLCVDDEGTGNYYGILGEWRGTTNALFLGYYLARDKSRPTYIYGNDVAIFSKVDGTLTKGFSLNTKGNVCIGNASPSSTVGDILALSPASSSSYTAILYNRPSGYASWSVAANNSNNFYWYRWGGTLSGGTAMSLSESGSLTLGSGNGTYIKVGGLYLVYDSTNNALKVSASATGNDAANFYATGAVSALGTGSSGGSGTDTQDTAGIYQSANEKLYLIGSKSGPQQTTNAHAQTYENSACYIGTDNCLYSNSKKVLSAAGGSISSGHLYLEGAQASSATSNTTQIVFGTSSAQIVALSGITGALVVNSASGTSNNNTQIGTGDTKTYFNSQKEFIIGATSVPNDLNSPKFYVNGNSALIGCVAINTAVDTNYKLKVSGKSYFSEKLTVNGFIIEKGTTDYNYNVGADSNTNNAKGTWKGNFTSGSDIRQKDVIRNLDILDISLEEIARTPIFEFTWNDKRDTKIHLGTSAQYWDSKLPSVVYGQMENDLSMDYGATALAAAVMTARTVLSHEERIKKLEAENERLRNEIELLKAA